jgi:hypothetical protein
MYEGINLRDQMQAIYLRHKRHRLFIKPFFDVIRFFFSHWSLSVIIVTVNKNIESIAVVVQYAEQRNVTQEQTSHRHHPIKIRIVAFLVSSWPTPSIKFVSITIYGADRRA